MSRKTTNFKPPPSLVADEYVTARYMDRFACVGADCEDTCCAGWTVILDRRSYNSLRQIMRRSEREGAFHDKVRRLEDSKRTDRQHAVFKMGDDGECSFLADDGLCEIQRDFGAGALCGTCSTYPRKITRVGSHIELHGQLSCSEVARLCVLAHDAFEIEPLDLGSMSLPLIVNAVEGEAEAGQDPRRAHFELVRRAMVGALLNSESSISTRSLTVAWLARRLDALFGPGAESFRFEALEAELGTFERPDFLQELGKQFEALPAGDDTVMSRIEDILLGRMQPGTKFSDLVIEVFEGYEIQGGHPEGGLVTGPLRRAFQELQGDWRRHHGPQWDRLFANLSAHYWMIWPYVDSPSVLVHARRLELQLALTRFMAIGKLRLAGVAPEQPDASERLAAAVVEVTYRLARKTENNAKFFDAQIEDSDPTLTTLAHVVQLIQL